MGEKIAIGGLEKELEVNCPFNNDVKGVDAEAPKENIAYDDLDNVQEPQANNGGILGDNLSNASNGVDNTWKGAPYEPPRLEQKDKKPPKDSKRRDGTKYPKPWAWVRVPGTKEIETGNFPFTVAAHHLIPGNASLYNEDNDLQNYLIKGKIIESVDGKSWTIKYHIGYNVNGAHNGVWLPGNYAIRSRSSPTKVTWGKMGHEDWQLNYVAACVKVAKGQFHDAHGDYNDSVRELLNKIAKKLYYHHCSLCDDKDKVPPPYRIKQRLYNLSRYFKNNLTLEPSQWRRPWFTSDRWRDVIFKNKAEKPCKAFIEAFNQASCVEIEMINRKD